MDLGGRSVDLDGRLVSYSHLGGVGRCAIRLGFDLFLSYITHIQLLTKLMRENKRVRKEKDERETDGASTSKGFRERKR